MRWVRVSSVFLLLSAGCGSPMGARDAGPDVADDGGGGGGTDAMTGEDAAQPDGGADDAGSDAGVDAGPLPPPPCVAFGGIAPSVPTGSRPVDLVLADFDRDGMLDLATVDEGDGDVTVALARPGGELAVSTTPALGYPRAMRAGDLNGDGAPDLAVAGNDDDGSLQILLNDGSGGFEAQAKMLAVSYQDLAIFDADEDGNADVLVVSPYSDAQLLIGRGDGTFEAPRGFAIGGRPREVRAADLDGDGHVDLLVADQEVGMDGVRVALGNGDGTFDASTHAPVPIAAWHATTGDVDGDGDLDVFTSHSAGGIHLLTNRGDGALDPAVEVFRGDDMGELATGDLNGDGHLDVVGVEGNWALDDGEAVVVLLGRGDGSFQPGRRFATGLAPVALALGDVTGDGALDVTVASVLSATASVLAGDSAGELRAGELYPVENQPEDLAAADLDADGRVDIITLDSIGSTSSVLLSTTDSERFEAPVSHRGGSAPDALLLTDFTGDDVVDLVHGTHQTENLVVLPGYGDGLFATPVPFELGFSAYALGAGDFDGDSRIDLAAADSSERPLSLVFGDGAGGVAASASADIDASGYPRIAVRDFDGDGADDVAAATGRYLSVGSVTIVSSSSARELSTRSVVVTAGGDIRALGAADLDDDGDPDLAVAFTESGAGHFLVLLDNDGSGGLSEIARRELTVLPVSMLGADADGDGDEDLLTLGGGRLELYLSGGADLADPLTFAVAGDRMAAGDFDADGSLDLAATRAFGGDAVTVVRGCP